MYDAYSVFPNNDIRSFEKFIFDKDGLDLEEYDSRINETFHFLIFYGNDSFYHTNYRNLLGDEINELDTFFEKNVNKNAIYFNGEIITVNSKFVDTYYYNGRYELGMLAPDIVLCNNNFYLRLDLWSHRFLRTIFEYDNKEKLFKDISSSLEGSKYINSITTDIIINYKHLGRKEFRDLLITRIENSQIVGINALYASRILYYIYNDYKYSFKCLLLARTNLNVYTESYTVYRIASEFLLMFNELEISLYTSLLPGLNNFCYRKLWFYYYSRLIEGISNKITPKPEYARNIDAQIPFDLIRRANIDNWISESYGSGDNGFTFQKYSTDFKGTFSLDLYILDHSYIENFFYNLDFRLIEKISQKYGYFRDIYELGEIDLSKVSIVETLRIMGLINNSDAFNPIRKKTINSRTDSYDDKLKSLIGNDGYFSWIINLLEIAYIHEIDFKDDSISLNEFINNKLSKHLPKEQYKCKKEDEYYYLIVNLDNDNKILEPNSFDEIKKIIRLFSSEHSRNSAKKQIENLISDLKKPENVYSLGCEELYRIVVMACLFNDIQYAKKLSSLLYKYLIVDDRSESSFDYYKILYIENKLNDTHVANKEDKIYPNEYDYWIAIFNKMSSQIKFNQGIEAIKSLDLLRAHIGNNLTNDRFGYSKGPWGTYELRDFSKFRSLRNRDLKLNY